MNIYSKAKLIINKPIKEVFNAIIDPTKLCLYFTSTASAPLVEGLTTTWRWADVEDAYVINVRKVEEDKFISFTWIATDTNSLVEITVTSIDANSTLVNIIETGWELNAQGVEYVNRQTGGWMHMLCCLKAFLEFGINLRKGLINEK